jgi:hypothetical protein
MAGGGPTHGDGGRLPIAQSGLENGEREEARRGERGGRRSGGGLCACVKGVEKLPAEGGATWRWVATCM